MTTLRRLVARAMADTLVAYVVPDGRTARAAGLDLGAARLEVAATPRHASVLLVVGDLPNGLNSAAAVVYAQTPRPRAILALGSDTTTPLPPADVVVALDQRALEEGVARIRALMASDAWSEAAEPFTADPLAMPPVENAGMDHGAHGHGGHGMAAEQSADHSTHDGPGSEPAGHNPRLAAGDTDTSQGPTPDEQEHHGKHQHDGTMDAMHGHHSGMDHGNHHQASGPQPGHDPDTDDPGRSHPMHDGVANGDHDEAHNHAGQTRDTADQGNDPDERQGDHSPENPGDRPGMRHDHHAGMAAMDHGDRAGMDHGEHGEMAHASTDHDMSGHDHHMMEGGFMSMIMMTKDLPRSRDGLPMEWTEATFGPLFPGLPAGIAATLTLDGDTVTAAALDTGHVHRGIAATLPGPATSLSARVARLDPLAPVAYRVLAARALAAIDGPSSVDDLDRRSIGAVERERVASHLGWFAEFLGLLGVELLAARAARLHLGVSQAPDVDAVLGLRQRIERLTRDTARTLMLRRRTTGIGRLDPPAAHQVSGPVARAAGRPVDARTAFAAYRALGFEPTTRDAGDVDARLRTRLAEIGQSLNLIDASGTVGLALPDVPAHLTGSGLATIETPRGAATLHVAVHHGVVHEVHLNTPSSALRELVPEMTERAELADALVAIASLDISPWEVDQ